MGGWEGPGDSWCPLDLCPTILVCALPQVVCANSAAQLANQSARGQALVLLLGWSQLYKQLSWHQLDEDYCWIFADYRSELNVQNLGLHHPAELPYKTQAVLSGIPPVYPLYDAFSCCVSSLWVLARLLVNCVSYVRCTSFIVLNMILGWIFRLIKSNKISFIEIKSKEIDCHNWFQGFEMLSFEWSTNKQEKLMLI